MDVCMDICTHMCIDMCVDMCRDMLIPRGHRRRSRYYIILYYFILYYIISYYIILLYVIICYHIIYIYYTSRPPPPIALARQQPAHSTNPQRHTYAEGVPPVGLWPIWLWRFPRGPVNRFSYAITNMP